MPVRLRFWSEMAESEGFELPYPQTIDSYEYTELRTAFSTLAPDLLLTVAHNRELPATAIMPENSNG